MRRFPRKGQAVLPLVILLLIGSGCRFPTATARFVNRPTLRVTFLDVGQGDSTVIESPSGRVVVVDGGGVPGTNERMGHDPGSQTVVPFLRSRGISTVDLLVATHPDEDHVQGLIAVTERLSVRAALDNGHTLPAKWAGAYKRLRGALAKRGIPVRTARRGQAFDLGGGVRLEVLHPGPFPTGGTHSVENNDSVMLRLVYNRARFVLTGDAEEEAESAVLQSGKDISADVLKAGHHGSRWSSTWPFIRAVQPSVTIISSGANNRYGHPHRDVLGRFAAQGVRVLRTDRQGAVTIESDGITLRISTVR